ncbi:MAG: hypothetical protein H6753_03045 [Candidatus Omnitrophica bacterium]|nr:hypothetical protein [Candidatus Omnitrophota bacterium]
MPGSATLEIGNLSTEVQPRLQVTLRQRKYFANRFRGMNQYKAARSAGYSETYARDHANKIEMSVRVGMAELLERAGITDKLLAENLIKGFEATGHCGKDLVEYPDWGTRHKFLVLVLKLTGRLV